jgi:hypothetical protein
MRELTQDEINLVSGGAGEDDERRLPPVTTTIRRRPRSDPFLIQQQLDSLAPSSWEIAGGVNLGGGGSSASGESSEGEEHDQHCESLAADVASAQSLVDTYEDLLRDQQGVPSTSEIIVDGRDAGPDAVQIASSQAWHAAFEAELAEA